MFMMLNYNYIGTLIVRALLVAYDCFIWCMPL